MVGRHLSAIDGILLPHPLLNEGVPGLGHDRDPARSPDQFLRIPDQTGIMQDLATRLFLQELHGQQADQIIPFDKIPLLVPEKAAVKITIPGNPHTRPMLPHQTGRLLPPVGEQRIGHPVGKGPIRFVMKFYKPDG